MSYDLYLIELPEGGDIVDALESHDDRPPSAELAAQVRSIVDSLAHEGYEYNEWGTQIFNGKLGATIDVGASGAVLNAAYWHQGAEAERAMRSVIGLVGQIQDATGWTLYDPQTDRVVVDRSSLLGGAAKDMDRIAGFVGKNIAGKRPWWKFWD